MRKSLIGVILVALPLAVHVGLRRTSPPAIEETVAWSSLSSVGQPPYPTELLLDFSADWCAPCREMKLTTFRDPEFPELLREFDLTAVRIEDKAQGPSAEFETIMSRFRVRSLPALVWVAKDGTPKRILHGRKSTSDVRWVLETQGARSAELSWQQPDAALVGAGRLEVRLFDKWFMLPPESRGWLRSPRQEFVDWASNACLFIADDFGRWSIGRSREYYREFNIRHVPTVVVTRNGAEVARFEGSMEVDSVPEALSRLVPSLGEHQPPTK
jgi:thioredoxin-like negative regulator of GroEL